MGNTANNQLEELRGEADYYPYNPERGYLFVSYAHADAERVLPIVLEWMKEGYNVYMDAEFGKHSSDDHWITQMKRAVSNPNCRAAVCFTSSNYFFSYASLLEVVTILRVKNDNLKDNGTDRPDFLRYMLESEETEVPEELRPSYNKKFEEMEKRMGETQSFRAVLKKEHAYEDLKKGLESIFKSSPGTPDIILKGLENSYYSATINPEKYLFFSSLARAMHACIEEYTGNDMISTAPLDNAGVEKIREPDYRWKKLLENADKEENGDPLAMCEVGFRFIHGNQAPKAVNVGIAYLEKAARPDSKYYYPPAAALLGDYYISQRDNESIQLGIYLLNLAGSSGYYPANLKILGIFTKCKTCPLRSSCNSQYSLLYCYERRKVHLAQLNTAAKDNPLLKPLAKYMEWRVRNINSTSNPSDIKQSASKQAKFPPSDLDPECFLPRKEAEPILKPIAEPADGQPFLPAQFTLAEYYARGAKGETAEQYGRQALALYEKVASRKPFTDSNNNPFADAADIVILKKWMKEKYNEWLDNLCLRARIKLVGYYTYGWGEWLPLDEKESNYWKQAIARDFGTK